MQNEWWMRPALQKSEAVLLPALERRTFSEYRFSDRFTHVKPADDMFRPVTDSWSDQESKALSTYVRARGSMAGRGVLRAAGVSANPFVRRSRPRYANASSGLLQTARRRFR